MTMPDDSLRTLTDATLAQIAQARHDAMRQTACDWMLLEVNGAQYSTAAGCAEAERARRRMDSAKADWQEARAEQKRRQMQEAAE